jgi:hypothetical protein
MTKEAAFRMTVNYQAADLLVMAALAGLGLRGKGVGWREPTRSELEALYRLSPEEKPPRPRRKDMRLATLGDIGTLSVVVSLVVWIAGPLLKPSLKLIGDYLAKKVTGPWWRSVSHRSR